MSILVILFCGGMTNSGMHKINYFRLHSDTQVLNNKNQSDVMLAITGLNGDHFNTISSVSR